MHSGLLIIWLIILFILIGYIIFFIVCWKNNWLMFQIYNPPAINGFKPFKVTQLDEGAVTARDQATQAIIDWIDANQ